MNQTLEEVLFGLQRMNLSPNVRQVVEEAAELLANGRNMEAGALIEKAEAMAIEKAKSGPRSDAHPPAPTANSEQVLAGMVGKVANGIAEILIGAFRELETHILDESRKLNSSFQTQLESLGGAVTSLTSLKERFDLLNNVVSEQKAVDAAVQQQCDQISVAVASLKESDGRREAELGSLRRETRDLSAVVSAHMESVAGRIGLQEQELSNLKAIVLEISPKMTAYVERLDAQGDIIQSLQEQQSRRTAALDQILGVLAGLRTPPAPAANAVKSAAIPA